MKKIIIMVITCLALISCKAEETATDNTDSTTTTASVGYFQVDNQSTVNIYQVYLREHGTTDWGADLLGGDLYLPFGKANDFSISACDKTYDARVGALLASADSDYTVYSDGALVPCGGRFTYTLTSK